MIRRRIGAFAAFLGALVVLLGIAAAPAMAYDHTYQVPSDNKTHAFIGSEPWMDNANADGCHLTGTYANQMLLYCVWMGIDNTILNSTTWENDVVFAVKYRCYDGWSGDAVTCSSVDLTAEWTWQTQPGMQVNHTEYRAGCHSTGGPGGCMGYTGSGTFTNNTGWLVWDDTATTYGGKGTTIIWNYTHAYSANIHFNGANVGIANSDIWRVIDTW